eukprot:3193138-Pyramimonas_sp.AAC.1
MAMRPSCSATDCRGHQWLKHWLTHGGRVDWSPPGHERALTRVDPFAAGSLSASVNVRPPNELRNALRCHNRGRALSVPSGVRRLLAPAPRPLLRWRRRRWRRRRPERHGS